MAFVAPPVSWQANDLRPVTSNAVPLLETLCQKPILRKARLARLPTELIDEIERDAKWPEGAKKMLAESSAAVGAKYLNRAGISAEYKEEVNLGLAIATIASSQIALTRRLDKLIAAANAGTGMPASSTAEKKA
jgi:hypothetical protein